MTLDSNDWRQAGWRPAVRAALLALVMALAACGGDSDNDATEEEPQPELPDNGPFLDYIEYSGSESSSRITARNGAYHTREWIIATRNMKGLAYSESDPVPNADNDTSIEGVQLSYHTDANGDGFIRTDYTQYLESGVRYDGTVLVRIDWSDDASTATFVSDFRNLELSVSGSSIILSGTITADLEIDSTGMPATTYTGDMVMMESPSGMSWWLDGLALEEKEDAAERPVSAGGRLYVGDLGYFDVLTEEPAARSPASSEFVSGLFVLQTESESLAIEPLTKHVIHATLHSPDAAAPAFFRINQDGTAAGLPFTEVDARPQYAAGGVFMNARPGDSVTLDVKGAAAPGGMAYTVEWVLLSKPATSANIMPVDVNGDTIDITPPVAGNYIIEARLKMGDRVGRSVFVINARDFDDSYSPATTLRRLQAPGWMPAGRPFALSLGVSENLDGEPLTANWVITHEAGGIVYETGGEWDVEVDGLPAGNYFVRASGAASSGTMPLRVGAARMAFEEPVQAMPFDGEYLSEGYSLRDGSRILAVGSIVRSLLHVSGMLPISDVLRFGGVDGYRIVGSGDLNGDGFEDLLVTVNSVAFTVFPGLADGGFGDAVPIDSTMGNAWSAIGDFDGNGQDEIIYPEFGISIMELDADFIIAGKTSSAMSNLDGMLVEDIDGDGDSDLIALADGSCQFEIWKSSGIGSFSFHSDTSSVVNCPTPSIHGGDLNGDGRLDLAMHERDPDTGYVVPAVLMQQTDGGFERVALENFPPLREPDEILVGDLDGQAGDEFVYVFSEGSLGIVGASAAGTWSDNWQFANAGVVLANLRGGGSIGDVDEDGKADIVLLSNAGFHVLRQR